MLISAEKSSAINTILGTFTAANLHIFNRRFSCVARKCLKYWKFNTAPFNFYLQAVIRLKYESEIFRSIQRPGK